MHRASKITSALLSVSIAALALAGCSSTAAPAEPAPAPATTVTAAAPQAPETAESTFVDGVLTTPELTITITDQKTIAVGEPGNEYGSVPVIAFYYDVTNLTDAEVSATDFIYYFDAYQDNDPNVVNELQVGSHPDSSTVDAQLLSIKKGGTQAGAMAYELSDTTTPVDLVATVDFGSEEIGRMTVNLT